MNKRKNSLALVLAFVAHICSLSMNAQDLISNPVTNAIRQNANYPSCGSFEFIEKADHNQGHFKHFSNQLMEDISQIVSNKSESRAEGDNYSIPTVFHIVYNDESENIPDSVILNQLNILNECFRRQNANASETRTVFLDLVGDARIEFRLAEQDPSGMPTSGITRTSSPIEHFGGLLPYAPGENAEIVQWINDSLFYNYFRLTETSLGGQDAWDTERYLNIWIGDLRIFEPQFNNFEELVYFGLATPPIDHVNWPDSVIGQANDFEQGVLMHYANIGSNNPNLLAAPYTGFNGVTTTGKMLVHEVGHYLGLRHIWGDGNCNFDDFIDDTPNSVSESSWNCNFNLNSCLDNIGDEDLPNMVENYMDYSSGDCQNSFTIGQADLMRAVLEEYRPLVYEAIPASNGILKANASIKCYPNPSSGLLNIDFGQQQKEVEIRIQNSLGQIVINEAFKNMQVANLNLNLPSGLYFLVAEGDSGQKTVKKLVLEQN